MLLSLGDERHTYFMTLEETEEKPEVFSTWPVSIGLQLEDRGDEIAVLVPLEDSPAKEAGLEPEDILVAVDGESVEGGGYNGGFREVRGVRGEYGGADGAPGRRGA
jgi:carboxyl-terminal processing protease